jgi:hypothetical protein
MSCFAEVKTNNDDDDADDNDCGSISLYVYFIENRVIIKGHDCT